MMKMKRSIIYISLFLALGAPACQETEVAPTVNDGVAPGPVTVSGVTNLSGAAEIYFQLPSDDDVLYVKGQCSTADGQVRESKVSYYNRSLTVSGFGDTREYDVQLYAVDKGGNESAPVSVTVHPEKAPFLLVYDSLKVISDFGGINISYRNEEEDNVAIIVLTDDSLGNFVPVNTHYTNLRRGDFSTRGLPSEETEFGVYIRDRWGNLSDTLLVTLKKIGRASCRERVCQ